MATPEQVQIAARLGVDVCGEADSVASARIHDAVSGALLDNPPRPATMRQRMFAEKLGAALPEGASVRVASAIIATEVERRLKRAIDSMKLGTGVIVAVDHPVTYDGGNVTLTLIYAISSVRDDGMVFFRGGNGKCAWADKVRLATEAEVSEHKEGLRAFASSRRRLAKPPRRQPSARGVAPLTRTGHYHPGGTREDTG